MQLESATPTLEAKSSTTSAVNEKFERLLSRVDTQYGSVIAPSRLITLRDIKIRTKDRRLISLGENLKPIQVEFLNRHWPEWSIDAPISIRGLRLMILKARQEGVSTLVNALIFGDTVNNPLTYSLILTHEKDATERMFQMMHRFWEHLPPHKQPKKKYSSKKELLFGELDSGIYVGTAGQGGVGRSGTWQHILKSEYAKWKPDGTTIEEIDAGLDDAVPEDGSIYEESTANGFNHYEIKWTSISSGAYAGRYKPVFFPWYLDPDYATTAPDGFRPNEVESEMADKVLSATGFRLSYDQLYWWRRKKAERKSLMAQEYPTFPQEAFVSSGNPRFNREYLSDRLQAIGTEDAYHTEWSPERIERPDRKILEWNRELHKLVEIEARSSWRGAVTTFVDPEPGHSYVIVADPAKGLTERGDPDYSVAHVYDLDTCEQVCHYRGFMTVFEMATDLYALGKMYHDSNLKPALIVIETPGPGDAVLSHLSTKETPYPKIYSYWDDDAQTGVQKKFGLPMGEGTRLESINKADGMIEEAMQGIRGSIVLRHPNTVNELMRFVKKRLGICEAENGAHDDEVSCVRFLAMIWGQFSTRGKKSVGQRKMRPPQTANVSSVVAGKTDREHISRIRQANLAMKGRKW